MIAITTKTASSALSSLVAEGLKGGQATPH